MHAVIINGDDGAPQLVVYKVKCNSFGGARTTKNNFITERMTVVIISNIGAPWGRAFVRELSGKLTPQCTSFVCNVIV